MNTSEQAQPLRPAALVRSYLPMIIAWCEADKTGERLADLLDADISKAAFGLAPGIAFFRLVESPTRPKHYAATTYTVRQHKVWLTQEWFDKHVPKFLTFLLAKGLLSAEEADALAATIGPASASPKSTKGSGKKVKRYPIQDAQNLAIRTVLDRTHLGPTAEEWLATVNKFGHACAYCRVDASKLEKPLVFEHIVGINKEDLGENVIGNVVPACAPCNDAKGSTDYRDWIATSPRIADAPAVLASIEVHMATHGYVSLTELFPEENRQRIDIAIAQLRAELDAAATRCAKIIKNLTTEREDASATKLRSPSVLAERIDSAVE